MERSRRHGPLPFEGVKHAPVKHHNMLIYQGKYAMIASPSETLDCTWTAPANETALTRATTAKNRRGLVRHD